MTRFKELRRIERAIEHRDEVDLRWAAEYCRMRLQLARTKQGMSQWRRLERRVLASLDEYNR
jgi:hypothetical protein